MLKIRTFDDPILKTPCDPVDPQKDDLSFIKDMIETLREQPHGVGLAAPQVGITKKVILVRPQIRLGIAVMVNPEIEFFDDEVEDGVEGCLSFPGISTNVPRHKKIRVSYLKPHKTKANKFKHIKDKLFLGWEARIIQHEEDHLRGICRVGDEYFKGNYNTTGYHVS